MLSLACSAERNQEKLRGRFSKRQGFVSQNNFSDVPAASWSPLGLSSQTEASVQVHAACYSYFVIRSALPSWPTRYSPFLPPYPSTTVNRHCHYPLQIFLLTLKSQGRYITLLVSVQSCPVPTALPPVFLCMTLTLWVLFITDLSPLTFDISLTPTCLLSYHR